METPRSLLDRLRSARDPLSWSRLVTLYSPWIRTILIRGGVASSDQDDTQQEVFAVLARELPQFDHSGRPGAFRSWLKLVVVHRLQHYHRTKQTTEQHIDRTQNLDVLPDRFSELESYWDQEHDRHIIQELLKLVEGSFSQTVWRAFQRQVLDGWKAAEAARELGVTVNTARLAQSRVLRRLRDESAGFVDDV
jgi:RNA polymerase sigma-70 factor (ECF subfamily)